MGLVQSPMPEASDYIFPADWALATADPSGPLQQYDNTASPFSGGFTQSVKLPGLTTPSGNVYGAAGVALTPNLPDSHTSNQVSGVSKKEAGIAKFYDTFGSRTAEGTCGKIGNSPSSVLSTGSIVQRFSGLPDPNTGQPAFTGS